MAASQRRKRDQTRGSTVSSTEPAKRRARKPAAEPVATDETHEKAKDALTERRRPAAESGSGRGRRVAAPAATPSWIAPVAVVLLIIGLLYLVTYYLSSATMPLPIGDWNLLVGFGVLALGGVTLMFWK